VTTDETMAGGTVGQRGRPPSAAAHRAVLEATAALVAERGIAGTSIDAIAGVTGVSKRTIYKHWPSKEALCLEAIRGLHPAANVPIPDSGDARADVVETLRRIARSGNGQGEPGPGESLLARLVGEAVDYPDIARVWRDALIAPRRARLAGVVQRAVAQGQLRTDTDVDLAVDLLIGPIFYRHLVSGGPTPPDTLPGRLVDAVWAAFAPPTATRDTGCAGVGPAATPRNTSDDAPVDNEHLWREGL